MKRSVARFLRKLPVYAVAAFGVFQSMWFWDLFNHVPQTYKTEGDKIIIFIMWAVVCAILSVIAGYLSMEGEERWELSKDGTHYYLPHVPSVKMSLEDYRLFVKKSQ